MSDRVERRDDRKRSSRSRSPSKLDHHAHRMRSPHHHHRRHKPATAGPEVPRELPFGARQLSRRDLTVFRPMFALYLDIQKQKYIDDIDEEEIKGRWKSFMGKWNRGELAEGWYEPSTLQKAIASSSDAQDTSRDTTSKGLPASKNSPDPDSESDDSVGPTLPGKEGRIRASRMGPSIPRSDDLELKREMEIEDEQERLRDMRRKRTAERATQKAALDELVPRAEAGTFERRLENKANVNATMKAFRERSPGGTAAEVPDTDLMGGGDGVSDFKRQKQEYERKKNEREVRKEEMLRARAAEREERLGDYAAKEERTMAMLRELAKQRFG